MRKTVCFILFSLALIGAQAQEIALLKYGGGGDWYVNPTSLPNLIQFCNEHIKTTIDPTPVTVTPESVEIFDHPFVHMTGHGNVYFRSEERRVGKECRSRWS